MPGRSRTPTTRAPGASATRRARVSGPAMINRSPDQIRSTHASGTTRCTVTPVVRCSQVQQASAEETRRSEYWLTP